MLRAQRQHLLRALTCKTREAYSACFDILVERAAKRGSRCRSCVLQSILNALLQCTIHLHATQKPSLLPPPPPPPPHPPQTPSGDLSPLQDQPSCRSRFLTQYQRGETVSRGTRVGLYTLTGSSAMSLYGKHAIVVYTVHLLCQTGSLNAMLRFMDGSHHR